LVPFTNANVWFVLLVLVFPMVAGNQAFPILLRLIVWVVAKYDKQHPEVYEYLLHYPRRCSTHLFPARETKLLAVVLAGIIIVEFGLFLLLDRNAEDLKGRSWGMRIVIAVFQSASTRTTGFNCVNLAKLSAAMNVLYLVSVCVSMR